MDQNLEYIEAQQQDLENVLQGYQQQIQQLLLQDKSSSNSRSRFCCF
jgi:hypothetical protein